MKLQKLEVGAHDLKQYTFRINEKEIDSLLSVIEMARAYVPRAPGTESLQKIRGHINIASREMKRALKEVNNPTT